MTILIPSQVREARALLGWSRDRLAALAEISVGCLERFEKELRTSEPSTLDAIRAALEAAGVEFTNGDSVKLVRRPTPEVRSTREPATSSQSRVYLAVVRQEWESIVEFRISKEDFKQLSGR